MTTTRSTCPTTSSGTSTSRRSRRRWRPARATSCRPTWTSTASPPPATAGCSTDVLRGTWGFEGFVVSDANAVHEPADPRLRRRSDRRRGASRRRRGRPGDGDRRSGVRPPARGGGTGLVSEEAIDAGVRRSSRPSCGWACSTIRTSTRTGRGRFSPTRRTGRWPGWRPSGRRCCCATRAACCR